MYVTKLVGMMFVCIFILDLIAAVGVGGTGAGLVVFILIVAILAILLVVSRQPQNR